MNEQLIEHLAKWLWVRFEYSLPISPSYMAQLIVKELDSIENRQQTGKLQTKQ